MVHQNESPHLQRLSIAAVEELRQTVQAALTTLVDSFVKRLAESVGQLMRKALDPEQQRTYQTLVNSLTVDQALWVETFVQHVDTHLIGVQLSSKSKVETSSSAADDSLVLASMELKAEARYRKQVTELDARVNRLQLMLYVPIYTKAVAPAGLSRSLQDTADAMKWPNKLRRLLFEKFDALLIPDLEGFYKSLIESVSQLGAVASKTTVQLAQGVTPTPITPRPKKPATQMSPPADMRKVDAETLSMLESIAIKTEGEGYTDGLLAADLLALADQRPLPGVALEHSWVPLQRMSLAGHFLNEVKSDPMVPDELQAQNESVRFPLVKSALTDETVLTSVTHPLNSMVNELLLKAATSRVTGNVETRRIADLLQQVLVQFDLAPEFVRQSMSSGKKLEDTQINRFFELQRLQAQQRRDFVISEAKRVVSQRLEFITLGRDTPASAVKFLNRAWGPLLTKRLLQHGANHEISKAGITLMEQFLDQLDDRVPNEPAPAEWKELTMTMVKALIAEGMSPDNIKNVLPILEAARQSPPTV
jgi:hypothetical protein